MKRVGPAHVVGEVERLPGPIGAEGAGEGLLPGVHVIVAPELRLVVELLGAEGTPVLHEGRLGSCDFLLQ